MENIPNKADSIGGANGQLPASQYNDHKNEIQKVVEKSGQALNPAITDQFSKALFINGVGAGSMVDTGAVNSIILSPKTGVNGLVVPDSYGQMNGGIFTFFKAASNTSAAVTINMGQTGIELGAKNLKRSDGTALLVGDVSGWCVVQWDQAGDQWLLISNGTDTYSYAASNGNVITPKFRNNIIVVDVSVADATITLSAPQFLGQKVNIVADGANLAFINSGNGIYTNGVTISENTSGVHFEAIYIGSTIQWRALDEITADYQAGSQRVKKSALGEMQILVSATGTTGAGATSNYYGSTSGNMYVATVADSFDVPFTAIPKYLLGDINVAVGSRLAILAAATYNIQIIAPSSSAAVSSTALFIGFY